MKLFFTLFGTFYCMFLLGQPTYIALTGNNNGGGSNNLFGNCLNVSQNAFVNWETFVDGGSCSGISSTGSGQGSKCRLILRKPSPDSGESVIASAPIIIAGIYEENNGNNDKYYANLNSEISTPGFYSVEIQCTCNDGVYDSDARTTWTYATPDPYWYNPSPALPIPLVNNFNGSNGATFLGYFTVGDVDMYRSMIVFNNRYYDLLRFTPGNPPAPASIQGPVGNTPAALGLVCGATSFTPPTLKIGAETNVFKRTGCSANISMCETYYRVYKSTALAPGFTLFNVPYKDGCPGGYNASTGIISTFSSGGSCYTGQTQGTNNAGLANCIESQRWQQETGVTNILPTSFFPSDVGTWKIDYYNRCVMTNCGGSNQNESDPPNAPAEFYTATFEVTATQSTTPGGPCYVAPLPVEFVSFEAKKVGDEAELYWSTASELNNDGFDIQRSEDGQNWQSIDFVKGQGNSSSTVDYHFKDKGPKGSLNYYRLAQIDFDGSVDYSASRMLKFGIESKLQIIPNPVHDQINLSLELGSDVEIYNAMGNKIVDQRVLGGEQVIDVQFLPAGVYVLKVYSSNLISSARFVKK